MNVSSRVVVFVCLALAAGCGSVQSDKCSDVTCGANATCDMDSGTCACDSGFVGDGMTCTPMDECAVMNDCDANATCTNTTGGGHTCACDSGYDGDGFTCTNIDECADAAPPCDVNATCTDAPGTFDCACNTGFDGDGFTCTDIDECGTGAFTCDPNATCNNTTGGYTCDCNPGYFGDGTTCFEAIGQAVLIGHDLFAANPDATRVVGNSVFLANTIDTVEVLGYSQFSDTAPGGEVANTDAAIQSVAGLLGRTVNITHVTDYTAIPGQLTGKHVFLIYEMETGGDPAAIGTFLDATLHTFVQNGGVVVALDYGTATWQVLDRANIIHNLGVSNFLADAPMTVAVPSDPIVTGVPSTYIGPDGTTPYISNDGVAVVVDASGNPVVVHKTFRPRFDGTFGATWEPLMSTDIAYGLMSYNPRQLDIYNMYGNANRGSRYSAATNTWSPLTNALPVSDPWFSLASVGRNLYGFGAYTTNIHKFSAVTETWSIPTTFTGSAAEYPTAVADVAGNIYGYLSNGNVVVYNPLTNVVSYFGTSIPALRAGNGSLYETRMAYNPGTHSLYMGGYGTPELYRFNLNTLATTQLTSIPEFQLNDMFCGDRSGHIYAAGDSGGTTFWQYTIATDTWTQLPDLPFDHGNNGSCTVSEAGYLYVGAGDTGLFARLPLN